MKAICLSLVLVVAQLAATRVAKANSAPPPEMSPSGSAIQPYKPVPTQVQMVSEQILIDVQPPVSDDWSDVTTIAKVTASFVMRNFGKTDSTLKVIFPVSTLEGKGNGYGKDPELRDFVVSSKGQILKTDILTTSPPLESDGTFPIKWRSFEVMFPVRETVDIRVTYVLSSTGWEAQRLFQYVVETGAGWLGKIEKSEITVRLPYAVSKDNLPESNLVWGTPSVQSKEARWVRKHFEPTKRDNFAVTILAPAFWFEVQAHLAKTRANPENRQLWQELYEKYTDCAGYYAPRDRCIVLAQQTLEEALRFHPKSDEFHATYAGVLFYRAIGFTGQSGEFGPDMRQARYFHKLAKLAAKTALRLNPNMDQDAKNVLRQIIDFSL